MRAHVILTSAALLVPSLALAAPGENSFTPTSLRVPIYGIFLSSSPANTVELYHCGGRPVPVPMMGDGGMDGGTDGGMDGGVESDASLDGDAASAADGGTDALDGSVALDGAVDGGPNTGASDPCLVDMADPAALSALFAQAIDVRPGTYDTINFGHCLPGAPGYSSYVRGQVSLDGTTYYTTTAPGHVLTTDSTLQGEVPLEHAGCGSSVALPGSVTIAENQEVTISAFFSLTNITWGSLHYNGIGGCANSSVGTESLCTSYPIPVAYLGEVSPILETYYITEDTADVAAVEAGGQMLILKDAMNHPFGGFARRLYSPSSVQPSVSYDTPIKTIAAGTTANTYEIDTWGGGGPGGVAIENYIRFPAFELMSHEATLVRGDGGGSVPYRAVKQ